MKIRSTILFAALLLASASALAFHCPADMKKIDEALAKSPKLTAQQMTDVKKFRADGEGMHKAGLDLGMVLGRHGLEGVDVMLVRPAPADPALEMAGHA